MESYEILGFFGILRACLEAISKNGKLIATITTISILLNSLLFFTKSYSTKPAIGDLLTQETLLPFLIMNPNTTNFVDSFEKIKTDVQIIIGFEFLYMLPSWAISLFSTITMILASAFAYSNKKLSCFDFLSKIPRLCLITLVTTFHLKLLAIGYFGFFSILLVSSMILCIDHPLVLIPIVITVGFFGLIFWTYLAIVWHMALVISVMEKSCYGLQALGKAAGLVKGRKLHGFTLNILYLMVAVIISMSFRVSPNQKSVSTQIICGFFAIVFNCLVTMVYLMSFTVLYFQCKKTHGEEIEMKGSLKYNKIPSYEEVAQLALGQAHD